MEKRMQTGLMWEAHGIVAWGSQNHSLHPGTLGGTLIGTLNPITIYKPCRVIIMLRSVAGTLCRNYTRNLGP